MLKFMDYVVYAFGDATEWNRDNSYSSLTATSDGS
jgi:mitochondrial distribution and morphology protein 10